jgi:hypothetical protein
MTRLVTKFMDVEAVQWNGHRLEEVAPDWMVSGLRMPTPETPGGIMRIYDEVHVGARNGVMIARPGDWIVRIGADELTVVPQTVVQALFHLPTSAARLVRFGHHVNPALDFCIEVETIEGHLHDAQHDFPGKRIDDTFLDRIRTAMDFVVGGDPIAVSAKETLRRIHDEVKDFLGDESADT